MAFSNEDILSWFCATNPLPEVSSDTVETLPTPGHSLYGHQFRGPGNPFTNGQETSPTNPTSPLAGQGGHLQQSLDDFQGENPSHNFADIEDLDADDLIPGALPGSEDYDIQNVTAFYERYSFAQNDNPQLPIAQYREKVISTIEANQVTIIQGATGSGKSTQVPQYILEHYASERRHCNIVCTQPRRIAATSVAKFVSESRGWPVGSLVGYQIHLDREVTEDTRLTFVTTGLLQEKLVGMKNMNQYTHVILDEVHERDKETDFLLLLVRKLLRTNSRHVKVILMSATFASEVFAQYFAVRISGRLELAPVVMVEGRSYPVTEFYLDDLKHIGECEQMDTENPRINDDAKELAYRLIAYFDKIEAEDQNKDVARGTVLVFLPGMPEIKDLDEKLRDMIPVRRLTTLPLHSTISPDEQYRVFLRPERGQRKVILATNIAESSITVPDIKYVIDFCLVKESVCDPETNYQRLPTRWASKASLIQRKGRAGRVSAGRCYRLITREFFRTKTPEYSTPEMLRTSLENLVLKAKKLQDLGEPRAILSLALNPPNLAGIERAVIHLKEVGALTVMLRGVVNPYDGELTFMGRVLEQLPVDVKVGKLLLLGHAFGCLGECLVIAAALSNRSFFTKPYKEDMKGYMSKMEWTCFSFSDCLAILNAYKEWLAQKQSGKFRSAGNAELKWCRRNLIHKGAINAAADLVRDLEMRLGRFNIKSNRNFLARYHESPHDILILKLVICGAFYPNYFRWGVADEEINQREMSGHDPTSTIVLSGLPPHPEQYARAICQMFVPPGNGKFLHFEGSKVFIEFEREHSSRSKETMSTVPLVLKEVYTALKRRYLRKPLELFVNDEAAYHSSMREETESIFLEEHDEELKPITLPKFGLHQIVVTEIIDAGHFWAQFGDMETVKALQTLMDLIKQRNPAPIHYCSPQELVGRCCLARYSEDGFYYRAKVLGIHQFYQHPKLGQPSVSILLAEVMFVDYGNIERVSLDFLCELTMVEWELPMQAFECFLISVKPSYKHSPEGQWSTEAIFRFKELCGEKYLIVDVFSEVNGVLRVALYDTTGQDDILINRVLVEEGFATDTPEPHQSKVARTQALTAEQAARQRRQKEQLESAERSQREEKGKEKKERAREETRGRTLQSSNCTTVEWSAARDWRVDCQLGKTRYPGGKTTRIVLRGPNNPYEVSFYSMTSVGCTRPARIERDSVNSVVIDNEPWDKHERLMVAAFVSLNPSASATLARDTTLLPNIHGLPHLVCLLFAPAAEMRTDWLKRQYTGAICGLGFDPSTGGSLYPEEDIELTFDTLITQEDLFLINRIRSVISLALTEDAKNSMAEWGEMAARNLQNKARDYLTELVLKHRESVPPVQFIGQGWNQVPPDDILVARAPGEIELDDPTSPPVYQLHNGIAISGERIDRQRATRVLLLRGKMRELHQKASKSMKPELLVCPLCNVRCSNPRELLAHLQGRIHRAAENKLFQDDLELDLTEKQLEQMHL